MADQVADRHAQMHGLRFVSQDKKTSIHFVIGKQDGEISQLMDTSQIAYHASRANAYDVAIE